MGLRSTYNPCVISPASIFFNVSQNSHFFIIFFLHFLFVCVIFFSNFICVLYLFYHQLFLHIYLCFSLLSYFPFQIKQFFCLFLIFLLSWSSLWFYMVVLELKIKVVASSQTLISSEKRRNLGDISFMKNITYNQDVWAVGFHYWQKKKLSVMS